MKAEDFVSFLNNYTKDQKTILDSLGNLAVPNFQSFQFSKSNITIENCREWIEELHQSGIDNKCSVLYYFEIVGSFDNSQITETIERMKMTPGRSERALPKINGSACNNSRILYVGKTNKNFLNRFKQHLGLGSASTYALHLSHWNVSFDMEIVLKFAICPIEQEQVHFLEHIESALHYSLKPILGRSGH